jgi:hypothetical protein
MNTIRKLAALLTLLGVTAAASAQVNIPNPHEPGNSMVSAVRIVATSDMMVDRTIRRWIRSHYPGWNAEPHEFQELGNERYAVVYMTHPENPSRRIYFRIVQSFADPDDGPAFPL